MQALAPLRLLALEVQERMLAAGVACLLPMLVELAVLMLMHLLPLEVVSGVLYGMGWAGVVTLRLLPFLSGIGIFLGTNR